MCAYFNPYGDERRLRNHLQFVRSLRGCDLFVIEMAYDGRFHTLPQFRVYGNRTQILWQKEALINEAVRRLPPQYTKIAWLDGDISFENPRWAEETCAVLDHVPIAQVFSDVAYCGPDGSGRPERRESSLVASVVSSTAGSRHPNPGLAWASRREFLERHGLPAKHVLGGGDVMLVHALFGWFDLHRSRPMNRTWRRWFLRWATQVSRDVRGRVGCVDGRIVHAHHGNRATRRYHRRWRDLARHDFDPDNDVRIDRQGPLAWASAKPKLHEVVRRYFVRIERP